MDLRRLRRYVICDAGDGFTRLRIGGGFEQKRAQRARAVRDCRAPNGAVEADCASRIDIERERLTKAERRDERPEVAKCFCTGEEPGGIAE